MSEDSRQGMTALLLKNLPPHLAEWLQGLPDLPGYSDPLAEERLFPDPCSSKVSGLLEDWKSYVQPELAELFRNSREVVRQDVSRLTGNPQEGFSLSIPKAHFDAWIGTLNQCRLTLGAIHQFGEKDLEADLPQNPDSEREDALLQIHFFGYLQELLIKGSD